MTTLFCMKRALPASKMAKTLTCALNAQQILKPSHKPVEPGRGPRCLIRTTFCIWLRVPEPPARLNMAQHSKSPTEPSRVGIGRQHSMLTTLRAKDPAMCMALSWRRQAMVKREHGQNARVAESTTRRIARDYSSREARSRRSPSLLSMDFQKLAKATFDSFISLHRLTFDLLKAFRKYFVEAAKLLLGVSLNFFDSPMRLFNGLANLLRVLYALGQVM